LTQSLPIGIIRPGESMALLLIGVSLTQSYHEPVRLATMFNTRDPAV